MTTKNSKVNAEEKTPGRIPKSKNLTARTTKSAEKVNDNTQHNTTTLDNGQNVLEYSHSDVQQILYLSMVTGFMLCNYATQHKVENVNLDKLAENVYKHLTTIADIKALYSSPQVALGFAVEASEAVPENLSEKAEEKTEKKTKKRSG